MGGAGIVQSLTSRTKDSGFGVGSSFSRDFLKVLAGANVELTLTCLWKVCSQDYAQELVL